MSGFASFAGGRHGTAAGLEFKRRLEELEDLEFKLMQIVADEIQDSIDEEIGKDIANDMKLLQKIKALKDNAIKTMQIMQALARYSGLKRGTLPRDLGLNNEPKNEIEEARKVIEQRRAEMNAKKVS